MAEGCSSVNDGGLDFTKYGCPYEDVLRRYKLHKRIGSGGFGDVIEVYHLSSDGTLMAMKLLRYDHTKVTDDAQKETWNIYKAGQHTNVAIFYDHFPFSPSHHAITMELFDMDVSGFFQRKENRVIPLKVDVSLQIATGLAYLHSRNPQILHRDIKPQNILIKIHPETKETIVKLSDFGISNIIETSGFFENPTKEQLSNAIRKLITTVGGRGTQAFLAPEFYAAKDGRGLVNGKFRIDASVDIFALGLVYLFIFFYNCNDYGKRFLTKYMSIMCLSGADSIHSYSPSSIFNNKHAENIL